MKRCLLPYLYYFLKYVTVQSNHGGKISDKKVAGATFSHYTCGAEVDV
jgi:hypothetical protein